MNHIGGWESETRTHSDLVVWDDGDLRGVALHNWGETDFELRQNVAVFPLHHPRFLAPGNKMLVLVHAGHHIVDLLWRKPEDTDILQNEAFFII